MTRRFDDKFSWEHAITESDLPGICRHILLTMSVRMDKAGGSCFPTIDELVEMTGLTKNTVRKYRDIAIEQGWLVKSNMGFRGQKWRRSQYVAAIPGTTRCGIANAEGGAGDAPPSGEKVGHVVTHVDKKGGSRGDPKVGHVVTQDKEQTNKQTTLRERARGEDKKTNGQGTEPDDQDVDAGREADPMADDRRALKALKREHAKWPTYAADSRDETEKRFLACSPADRRTGIERWPAYVDHVRQTLGRAKICAMSTYWADRRWQQLPPDVIAKAQRATANAAKAETPPDYAPAFGPVWSAWRLAQLLAGPENPDADLPQTPLAIHFRAAWPQLMAIEAQGRSRRGIRLGARWHGLKPAMEAVPLDSDLARSWQAEFARRRWPWATAPGMDVAYLPKAAGGAVQPALAAFERALAAQARLPEPQEV